VHVRQGPIVEATLELSRGEISKRFRTRNTTTGNTRIDMQLVDGPFRTLAGSWSFTQLGSAGSKVALDIEFEYASRVVELMFGAFFEETCNTLVEAFTRRADAVFATTAT
jgi:ribosome-associated toxin RatA of RatAB toxin-antitoxin module